MEAPAGHGGGLAVTFDADPGPGRFSPVFQPTPAANTASLNAGDRGLYVGGRAINGAFRDALVAAGHRADTRGAVVGYDVLHRDLLIAAQRSPGSLCWCPAAKLPMELVGFCGLVPPAAADLPVGMVAIAIFAGGKRPANNNRNVAMICEPPLLHPSQPHPTLS